jgi:glycopeptide antibiotics resistance protein
MVSGLRRAPLWCWWIAVVWLVSFPWLGRATAPQWHRVHWVPFADPADKITDVLANVALFVPFGYSLARRGRQTSLLRLCVIAALVSASGEVLQLYSTDRFPSATDVTSAVLGAVAGRTLRLRHNLQPDPNL